MTETPTMLTLDQAAAKFNVTRYFCRQLVLEKKVRYVRAGKKYLINLQSMCDYLNNGEQ